jgi:glycosyltransferase involved in cell wall biosynthesis
VKFTKVFVLTSKWEGLPIALLEALALETPVVTSNCSSSIEFVMRSAESLPAAQEGNMQSRSYGECGFIIDPLKEESDADEVNVWRDAIDRILASGMAQPISGKRRLEAVQRFDVPQVKKEWEKIFNDRIC